MCRFVLHFAAAAAAVALRPVSQIPNVFVQNISGFDIFGFWENFTSRVLF